MDVRRDEDEGNIVGFAVRVELFETRVETDICYMSCKSAYRVSQALRRSHSMM
jgi:hypothetical protein